MKGVGDQLVFEDMLYGKSTTPSESRWTRYSVRVVKPERSAQKTADVVVSQVGVVNNDVSWSSEHTINVGT